MSMNEIPKRDTAILLAKLDHEIDMKCMELKEKTQELKLKRLFFTGCVVIMLVFLLQTFFSIFNVNYLFIILVYQAAALVVIPVVLNMTKGVTMK